MEPDAALLAAIHAAPDDDGPRLVYADVLVGRGDPRGELIQLQCALASLDADDDRRGRMQHRERALLAKHAKPWTAELADIDDDWTFEFRRGFVEGVTGTARSLAARAAQLVAAAPLVSCVEIFVYDRAEALNAFCASPLFGRLERLVVRSGKARIDLHGLCVANVRPRLRSLHLEEVAIGRNDVAAITEAPALAELRELSITMARLNQAALAPLAQLQATLDRLELVTMHSPALLVAALTTAPGLRALRALAIANNDIGDDGLAAIVAAGRLRRVEELDVRSNQLSAKALASLLAAGTLGPVRKLWLASNEVTDAFAKKLAAWPGASRLAKLDLGSNKLTDAGVLALAASSKLANLRSLVLSGVKLKKRTEAALLASPHLANSRLYVDSRFLARA